VPYLLNFFYLLLLLAASPWLLWQAVRKGKYREGYAAKFLGLVPRRTSASSGKKCVWLHAVSVGEVNLLAPLLAEIERQRPDWECVVSTTTVTGYALARKKYAPRTVFYCPLDFSWAVGAAMRRVRPDLLVLAELELWPNLIRSARRHGARVAVVNGRLSESSFRGYRRVRWLASGLVRRIDVIAAQDEAYAERFRALGARRESVRVTGSMKYDGARTDRDNPETRRLAALAGFAPDDVVFLAGSTQEPEEVVVLDVFHRLKDDWPQLKLAIVPRHPDRFDAVARLIDETGLPWMRRSALHHKTATGGRAHKPPTSGRAQTANNVIATRELPGTTTALEVRGPTTGREPPGATTGRGFMARVLLVDAVGELGAWWGTAAIAFVGGSLGNRGGQNMIEPAAYGAAVSFGPNTRNFRDVVSAMLDHNAAVVVPNTDDLTAFVRRCLEDPTHAAALGRRAQELVQSQLGATGRTFALLAALADSHEAHRASNRTAA